MTVYVPVGKIPLKATIPIVIVLCGLIAAVWILPLPFAIKCVVTLSSAWFCFVVIVWTIFGDF